jgi:transcriptional regulator with XRE-family HTH domain
MEYFFSKDLLSIREILGITQAELAAKINVQQVTISRSESGETRPSANLLEKVYGYAFDKNINLGKLKGMLWSEKIESGHKLLFHGAKSVIEGNLSVRKGRSNNDFGPGFYTGESYEQAISFVSGFEKSCVYFLDFDPSNLKCQKYGVNQEWMLTIAYYRGTLEQYESHPMIQKLIEKSRDCDYIIAPIADNRMFQIINSFINGEITDEQCKHCLAATNLGYQYVFISDQSVKSIALAERVYISESERKYYKGIRTSDAKLGEDKVKLARIEYRGQGHYIDEILN